MIGRLWRRLTVYSAVAEMAPKLFVAYRAWFWMSFFVQVLALTIFLFFWRAVYDGRDTLGGLSLDQTLNYILLAQVLVPLVRTQFVFHFGQMLVEGHIAMELLRPLDLQGRFFAEAIGFFVVETAMQVPLALLAWLVFGLRLPADPTVWGAFAVSFLLGRVVIFLFDWIFCCLAFYTTETWGLGVMLDSAALFFSGSLVPLDLMPEWLRALALALPFAQSIYVPVSLLAGIAPLSEAPSLWLGQALWIVALLVVSRALFGVAVRRVTVHGG